MSTVIEREPIEATDEQVRTDGLFQVWIDLNFGGAYGSADWWHNSEAKPLRDALQEAAKTRADGWVCKVIPQGQNPREDGRWDNPV